MASVETASRDGTKPDSVGLAHDAWINRIYTALEERNADDRHIHPELFAKIDARNARVDTRIRLIGELLIFSAMENLSMFSLSGVE